jgi:hypothetical protein
MTGALGGDRGRRDLKQHPATFLLKKEQIKKEKGT